MAQSHNNFGKSSGKSGNTKGGKKIKAGLRSDNSAKSVFGNNPQNGYKKDSGKEYNSSNKSKSGKNSRKLSDEEIAFQNMKSGKRAKAFYYDEMYFDENIEFDYDFRPGKSKDSGKGKKDNGPKRGSYNKQNVEKRYDRKPRFDKNRDDNDADRPKKKSRCPYFKKCGACQMIDTPYKEQLKIKQARVEELIGQFTKVDSFIGMEKPEHYRCKVHAVFTHDKKGNPQTGIYSEGTHDVVPIDRCYLEDEKADAIIRTVRDMLKSFKIKTFDENNGFGLFRHILVRVGRNSGQIMVVLVLTSPILPSKNNFVKALLDKHPEITTIVLNVNDKQTSMILGEKEKVLYGPGYITDTLCGMEFKISPKSFYQVNPDQTEVLYSKAIEFADLTGDEVALDCYCGVGTIGIIASPHVKQVVGVELNKDAVRDAKINAKMNNIKNINFHCMDASEFMVDLAEAGEKVDLVFMDPPRSGSTQVFIDSLFKLSPKKVVYISCSPDSLAIDLAMLKKGGYKVDKAVPVDMFPFTRSVETVVLLTRTKGTMSEG